MELNLAAICEAVEAAVPDRDCIVFRDRRLSWRDVGDRTRRLADVLVNAGLGIHGDPADVPGWESVHDHVALYLHNGNEYLEGMLGAYKARCAPVNVNYRYKAAELTHVLADSRSRAVVVAGTFAPLLDQVRGDLPDLGLILQVDDGSGAPLLDGAIDYEAALAAASPTLEPALVASWSPDDLYICYTGGTTGLPKGVLWRQADFLVSALGIRRRDGDDHESLDELADAARGATLRALPAPPLMHGAAHWNAISCWAAGGTVIIQDRPAHLDPDDIWRTVERHRATSLLIVGDPFARPLLDAWDTAARDGRPYDASSLRHVLSGGAVLSPSTKRALTERLGGVTVVDVLGSSESGRQAVATRRPPAIDATATTTGVAADDGTFRPEATAVVLSEDRAHQLAPGVDQVGWLAQTGRVPLGYLGDPDKTRATFPVVDGVRYAVAGDRARLVTAGDGGDPRIELLGRDSVTVNTGGEKVFAEEVETALGSHPAVFDAVVCGRPSERWGQEVVAVVRVRDGAEVSDDELRAHCGAALADFKVPKAIVRVGEVVRSPSGKADYRWAREVVADHHPPRG